MDQSEAALATVEAWWKKCFEISKDHNDPLFSLHTTTFETIMIYLSQSIDYENTQKSVASLNEQRELALLSEDKYDPLRHISFGMIEVVQAILLRDTRKLEEMIKSGFIPVPNIPNFNLSLPLEPKEEEMDDFNPVPVENEINVREDSNQDHLIKEEEDEAIEEAIHEEPIDESTSIPLDNQTSVLGDVAREDNNSLNELEKDKNMDEFIDKTTGLDDVALEENNSLIELKKGKNMDDFVDHFPDEIDSTLAENLLEDSGEMPNDDNMSIVEEEAMAEKDSSNDQSMREIEEENEDHSSNQLIEKGRKSARRSTRLANYKDLMDDSDDGEEEEEEEEPTVKRTRRDSEKEKEKKNNTSLQNDAQLEQSSHAKRSDTDMECIECEFRTTSVNSWLNHLRSKHSTTPKLSGLLLRCECGHETTSVQHSLCCNISNFTVIRKKDETIRRLEDVDASQVKCVLCETYPKTTGAYMLHLTKHHKEKSTLMANEIYLICSCGLEIRSRYSKQHGEDCDGRKFSIHKLEEVIHSTPKCVLCEFHPKTTGAYVEHLRKKHKDNSTLKANDIYLLCECGLEILTIRNNCNHIMECDGSSFTVHKLDDFTISQKAQSNPQCILCEVYPKTWYGYIDHLQKHHKEKSTLIANGIYLICACGFEAKSDNEHYRRHSKNCNEQKFTLHKLDTNETPKCIHCEAFPKTPSGYIQHIYKHHKDNSTLQSNGIYLLCACGFEVRSHLSNINHIKKKCDMSDFTLHKVNDE